MTSSRLLPPIFGLYSAQLKADKTANASRPAADFRDLDWVRLMRNTYRTEFVRSWVVALGVWAFTVVWCLPISLFVTLTSVSGSYTVNIARPSSY